MHPEPHTVRPRSPLHLRITIMTLLSAFIAACTTQSGSIQAGQSPAPTLSLDLYDAARQRHVPVALYNKPDRVQRPLAIISPGYGMPHTGYGFIANALAARGYVVAAIQQEQPGDPAPASSGNLAQLRRPIWKTGVDSIRFVMRDLEQRHISSPGPAAIVLGHSNGGDTSMLLATIAPDLTETVISLDNRRMPIPRTAAPRIYSIRSSDLPADEGVLPNPGEQSQFGIRLTTIAGLNHNDMWDGATPEQKSAMLAAIVACMDR